MIRNFFEWERTPFTKEIPTDHLYMSEQFKQCLARLQFMVMSRSFGCVTGDFGCGKSTAIRYLESTLDQSKYVLAYLAEANLRPREFYRKLLYQFEISPQFFHSETKRQFRDLIWDLYDNHQKIPVVVIDEAHLLQGDMLQEIRFLTNFQMDSVSPLALLLVGQPELQATLRLRVFKPITQRLNVRFHLSGLNLQETRDYIEHQLKAAGSTHPVFTTEAMDAIHAYSRGVCRDINNVCWTCLLDAVARQEKLIDTIHVSRILNEFND